MTSSVLFRRINRLIRKARDMRGGGASYRTILPYYSKFLAAKLPLAARFVRTRLNHRSLDRSAAERITLAGVPAILVTTGAGGLGDDIVIARFMRDLQASCGDFMFDVICAVPERSDYIFANVPGFGVAHHTFVAEAIRARYAVVLEIGHVAQVRWVDLTKLTDHPRLAAAISTLQRFCYKNRVEIAGMPYSAALFARQAVFRNQTRATGLHAQAGIPYGGPKLAITTAPDTLSSFALSRAGDYVTIHNGFDPAFVIAGTRATKCYPHFDAVVTQLKAKRPDLKIVQLGQHTSISIKNVDVDLLARTGLSEAAAVVGGARLHIDNEGGLVHLAAALGVRSCAVCGPTDPDYFSYPGNIMLRPPVCGGCWWTTESWMDICPRGLTAPPCMEQAPETVVAGILSMLD